MKNLLLSLILGITVITNAQNVEFKKKNFEDQEGFKTAYQSLKDGDKQFFAGDYSQALVFYKEAHSFNPDNAKLNFKMGVAHLKSEEKPKALDYFLKAKELDPQVDPKLNFALAQAYQENKLYKTAINTYKGYLLNLSASEKPSIEPKVNEKIKECEEAGGMDAVTEVKEKPIVVKKEPVKEIAEHKIVAAPVEIKKEESIKVESKPIEKEVEKAVVVETSTVEKENQVVKEKEVKVEESKAKSIESENEVVYRIQLVATSKDLSAYEIKKLYSGSKKVEKDTVKGVNKYLVGNFKTKAEAMNYRKNVLAKDAFVVQYKNGKRVY